VLQAINGPATDCLMNLNKQDRKFDSNHVMLSEAKHLAAGARLVLGYQMLRFTQHDMVAAHPVKIHHTPQSVLLLS
jgi:hypothetical protein